MIRQDSFRTSRIDRKMTHLSSTTPGVLLKILIVQPTIDREQKKMQLHQKTREGRGLPPDILTKNVRMGGQGCDLNVSYQGWRRRGSRTYRGSGKRSGSSTPNILDRQTLTAAVSPHGRLEPSKSYHTPFVSRCSGRLKVCLVYILLSILSSFLRPSHFLPTPPSPSSS